MWNQRILIQCKSGENVWYLSAVFQASIKLFPIQNKTWKWEFNFLFKNPQNSWRVWHNTREQKDVVLHNSGRLSSALAHRSGDDESGLQIETKSKHWSRSGDRRDFSQFKFSTQKIGYSKSIEWWRKKTTVHCIGVSSGSYRQVSVGILTKNRILISFPCSILFGWADKWIGWSDCSSMHQAIGRIGKTGQNYNLHVTSTICSNFWIVR